MRRSLAASAERPPAAAIRFTASRAAALVLGLIVLTAAVFALSVRFGEQPISLRAALTNPDSIDAAIFWSLRLPRAVLAIIVGAALGASGCTLQALMRNPLADPFVLGVSGGAALGATLAISAGVGAGGALIDLPFRAALARVSAPSVAAFVGALGATALVFTASNARGRSSPYAALLTGVIFNAFAAAVITCVKTLVAPEKLGEILYWLAGTLGFEPGWTLAFAALLQVLAVGAMWLQSGPLNLLTLGDEDAASLGVNVGRARWWLLLAASMSVAGAVALSGLIGFVGLIVPHVLRLWLGPDQRLLIPCSALGGSAFLCVSDLITRLLFSVFHSELPVGVITAMLGGPFFLILLHRNERGAR